MQGGRKDEVFVCMVGDTVVAVRLGRRPIAECKEEEKSCDEADRHC